jgi:hypothetical protein
MVIHLVVVCVTPIATTDVLAMGAAAGDDAAGGNGGTKGLGISDGDGNS